MNRHSLLAIALVGGTIAFGAGCSLFSSPESQLFSKPGRYESVALSYRLRATGLESSSATVTKTNPAPPAVATLASHEVPAVSAITRSRRVTALAIRYPHPSGRAGYARVELLVQNSPTGEAKPSRLPGWLDGARRMANNTLPGISMSDGVSEAMGLDVRIAELDNLLLRLEKPAEPAGSPNPAAEVLLKGSLNGIPLPNRTRRVADLDALVARVRCQGSIISHKSLSSDLESECELPEDVPAAASEVTQASYTESVMVRLPAVLPSRE